jgi:hypothetical protein
MIAKRENVEIVEGVQKQEMEMEDATTHVGALKSRCKRVKKKTCNQNYVH